MLRAVDTKYTFEAADRLTTFDKPALVLWGDNDKIFPREHGQLLAQLLPQGDFALIPDSRTFIPEEQPELLATAIADFLIVDMFANYCTGREDAKGTIAVTERQLKRIYR